MNKINNLVTSIELIKGMAHHNYYLINFIPAFSEFTWQISFYKTILRKLEVVPEKDHKYSFLDSLSLPSASVVNAQEKTKINIEEIGEELKDALEFLITTIETRYVRLPDKLFRGPQFGPKKKTENTNEEKTSRAQFPGYLLNNKNERESEFYYNDYDYLTSIMIPPLFLPMDEEDIEETNLNTLEVAVKLMEELNKKKD